MCDVSDAVMFELPRNLTAPSEARQLVEHHVCPVHGRDAVSAAQVPGYRVAGKTGTAHKPEAGTYAEHKYVSSFVGFGPVADPRFIVAVMIDEPSGAKYYGGDIGAPVFAAVMGAALRMMSVPPDAPQTLTVQVRAVEPAQARAPTKGSAG